MNHEKFQTKIIVNCLPENYIFMMELSSSHCHLPTMILRQEKKKSLEPKERERRKIKEKMKAGE